VDKEKALKLMEDLAERLIQVADELGYTFTIDVEAKLCEPEKPARKIDDGYYQKWHIDRGADRSCYNVSAKICADTWPISAYGGILSDEYFLPLLLSSPDAMRVMIDFVNEWQGQYPHSWSAKWIEVFSKIITDAGFGCDIKERDNG